jgi:hypothetical protein
MSNRVLIPRAGRRSKKAYHTDNSCSRAPSNPSKVPRDVVEGDGWHECQYCAGTHADGRAPKNHNPRQALKQLDPTTDLRELADD